MERLPAQDILFHIGGAAVEETPSSWNIVVFVSNGRDLKQEDTDEGDMLCRNWSR